RFLHAMFEHWHNLLYCGKSRFRLSWNLHGLAPALNHDWTAIRTKLEKRGLPVTQFRCDKLGRVTNDVTESLRQLSADQCRAASPRPAKQEQCPSQRESGEKLDVAPTG